jgi:peptidoglycan glycosyltransferase
MQFSREINRLLIGLLVSFFIVAVAAAYWAVVGPETVLQRDDNPRRFVAEASIRRGGIFDRDGEVLVRTVASNGGLTRNTIYRETYGALGYFSQRYGASGTEAAYDDLLRGETLTRDFGDTLLDELLHRPQVGSDIQVSLDLNVQQAAARALNGQTGAVVVMAVPSGEVLAMVSSPTYNPNTLDADWDTLRTSPGQPFFNRAVQGRYQPGGTLETPLMAAALINDRPINVPLEPATHAVQVDDVTLNCAVRLPEIPLSLRESYAFACPFPFVVLGEALGASALEATLDTFHLSKPPTLPGYDDQTPQLTVTPALASASQDDIIAAAAGQGELTVSPLTMAMMTAGIVNDGNAPQPSMLIATRAPGAESWTPVQSIRPTVPIATTNTARQLQDLMRYAVASGAAQNAGRPNVDIGGHASVAYAGENPLSWFIGFATISGRRGVSIAVVLENSADPGLAADIGGTVLAAAQQQLQLEANGAG